MTEGQKYLLKLFKEVDNICKKNNIRYYLAGGTLIGAIRHKGFVPWDDDFDLYMTRDEFDKFIEVSKKGLLPENRVLECQELNRSYRNVFARYTDTSTAAIHKNQLVTDDIAGEVLDILQIDPVPNNSKIQKKHFKLLMLYADLINPSVSYSSRCGWNKYLYILCKKLGDVVGKEKILEAIEKKMFKYNESECDTYIMRWSGAPLIFKKELFEPALHVQFEGIDATVPRKFNEYLVDHYGDDWIFIPKVEHQMSHEAVHSLNHDYRLIREGYQKYVDEKFILRQYKARKKSILFSADRSHEVADVIVELRGLRLKEELIKEISEEKIDLELLYKKENYQKLQKIFQKYYKMQESAQFIGRDTFKNFYRFMNPILIDLPVSILKIALKVQNDIGKTARAYRTIEIYEKIKKVLPKELKEIKQQIETQRSAVNLYTLGEKWQAKQIVEKVLENSPNNIGMLKLSIRLSLELSSNKEDILTLIKRGMRLYPGDGEFLKYKADWIFNKNPQKAYALYCEAKEKTDNGYILLEIEEKIAEYANKAKKVMQGYSDDGNYSALQKTYNNISSFVVDSEIEYIYLNGILQIEMSRGMVWELFSKAKFLIGEIENEKVENLLLKILIFADENLVVSKLRIDTLFFLKENEKKNKNIIDDIKNSIQIFSRDRQQYIPEIEKLLADIYNYEGDVSEAYELYRRAYRKINKDSFSGRELEEVFQNDINEYNRLKAEGKIQNSILNKNMKIKFGDVFKNAEDIKGFKWV